MSIHPLPSPAPDPGGEKYMVPALERGLRLMQEFGRDNATLGAPELARRLNLPRATVFRMLNTLEAMGFLQRAGSSDYRLGLAVLRMGFEFLASLELTQLGQPVIERLSRAIDLPCNIVVRDGRWIVYVAKVTPPVPFASSVQVGTRLPAHATVLGHVLLGDLSLPELRALYPEPALERHSAHTPATVNALFDAVQAARERGHVISEGFFESSICTVAAPVRDAGGKIAAALGTTLSATRLDPKRRPALIAGVCAAAAELSHLMDYRAPRAADVVPLRQPQGGRDV